MHTTARRFINRSAVGQQTSFKNTATRIATKSHLLLIQATRKDCISLNYEHSPTTITRQTFHEIPPFELTALDMKRKSPFLTLILLLPPIVRGSLQLNWNFITLKRELLEQFSVMFVMYSPR